MKGFESEFISPLIYFVMLARRRYDSHRARKPPMFWALRKDHREFWRFPSS